MATLTLDGLPSQLREAAALIDEKQYFSPFDEDQLRELASAIRAEIVPDLAETQSDLAAAKAKIEQSAAGAFHQGAYNGFAEHAEQAGRIKAAAEERAAKFDRVADKAHDMKARFFEIVVTYWQRAQFYGCKNPASLDALLSSNTVGVLQEARQAWNGVVEQYV